MHSRALTARAVCAACVPAGGGRGAARAQHQGGAGVEAGLRLGRAGLRVRRRALQHLRRLLAARHRALRAQAPRRAHRVRAAARRGRPVAQRAGVRAGRLPGAHPRAHGRPARQAAVRAVSRLLRAGTHARPRVLGARVPLVPARAARDSAPRAAPLAKIGALFAWPSARAEHKKKFAPRRATKAHTANRAAPPGPPPPLHASSRERTAPAPAPHATPPALAAAPFFHPPPSSSFPFFPPRPCSPPPLPPCPQTPLTPSHCSPPPVPTLHCPAHLQLRSIIAAPRRATTLRAPHPSPPQKNPPPRPRHTPVSRDTTLWSPLVAVSSLLRLAPLQYAALRRAGPAVLRAGLPRQARLLAGRRGHEDGPASQARATNSSHLSRHPQPVSLQVVLALLGRLLHQSRAAHADSAAPSPPPAAVATPPTAATAAPTSP
ncbi:vegetative cell wall protein gp1 [Gracilaria domingensis]|nr:vegetative cell wall protein gp1 [Gracilaria domingensis]